MTIAHLPAHPAAVVKTKRRRKKPRRLKVLVDSLLDFSLDYDSLCLFLNLERHQINNTSADGTFLDASIIIHYQVPL